ncbi:WD40-repeat-containing domain protein [Ganoderma leucocontextum]|nr:WD40-repeat-containing domain protein [Ganoderma leucocontextum]
MSLPLPWKVIERVIEHSADSIVTLYSFTLTCSELRPRSTILLLRRVEPKNREQLFALCAVLQARPHLQPCVRSIKIRPSEFSPIPLLRILPNLSEIEFADSFEFAKSESTKYTTFHPYVLTYCRQFGEHIQTLSLENILFSSLYALSGILLSFPRIQSLSCAELYVKKDGVLHQELIQRRRSARLGLKTLTIHGRVDDMVLVLLREVAKHTLAKLESVDSHYKPFETLLLKSSPSEWVHLGSLTWQMSPLDYRTHSLWPSTNRFITLFKDFRPRKLREVTVDIHFRSFSHLLGTLLPSVSSELRAKLETTLLTFPQPTLSFSSLKPLNVRRYHCWKETLGKFFPTLARRHALTINAESSGKAGHDGAIWTAIVVSANSRWAATGSEDGTIIIWDTETGCIAQEWLAHPNFGVRSLSLSPNSRYLLSDGCPGQSIVWDLHQDPRGAISLADCDSLNICAWSAEGSWIASESRDGTVHLWDAHTFQRLHPNETWKGTLLAFSPDGRWMVTSASLDPESARTRCRASVWNVESGKLHRELVGHVGWVGVAAFDPGSKHIVTAGSGDTDGTIRIWDVGTGDELLILEDEGSLLICFVAYSPDGKLVLSSSELKNVGRDIDHTGGVKIWDASTGALLACLVRNLVSFQVGRFYPACFSPCGRYVASASEEDGEVCLWRTSDWSCVAKVSGGIRRARVTEVAISPDGRVLCCGAEDGTVFFRRMCNLVSAEQYP